MKNVPKHLVIFLFSVKRRKLINPTLTTLIRYKLQELMGSTVFFVKKHKFTNVIHIISEKKRFLLISFSFVVT